WDLLDLGRAAAALRGQHFAERTIRDNPGVVIDAAIALGLADDRDHPVCLEHPVVDQLRELARVGHAVQGYLADLNRLGHGSLLRCRAASAPDPVRRCCIHSEICRECNIDARYRAGGLSGWWAGGLLAGIWVSGWRPDDQSGAPPLVTTVPARPASASSIADRCVMMARPSSAANRQAASTLGPMLPLPNSPRSASSRISATLTSPSARSAEVPQPVITARTSVAISSVSAPS